MAVVVLEETVSGIKLGVVGVDDFLDGLQANPGPRNVAKTFLVESLHALFVEIPSIPNEFCLFLLEPVVDPHLDQIVKRCHVVRVAGIPTVTYGESRA